MKNAYVSGQSRRDMILMFVQIVDKEEALLSLEAIVGSVHQWLEESPEKHDVTVGRQCAVLNDWAVVDAVRSTDISLAAKLRESLDQT